MKSPKYRAIPTEVDGIRFSSRKEARRYSELKLMERAGEISGLSLQPKFPIIINGVKVCTYIADFDYLIQSGERRIEDVKGMKTPIYNLKKKLMRAVHSVEIFET